jgi:hypothetical protein
MTGRFDETTRRLLRESDANGGLSNKNLFDLMVAGHDEGITTAQKLARETEEAWAALAETLAEDRQNIARIASHLESESGSINRAILAHCADTNAHSREPRRVTDPPDANYAQVAADPDLVRQMEAILRERDERRIVGLFMGRFGRAILLCCAFLAVACLVLYFFRDGHPEVAEIAAVISLTVPFVVIILAYRAPGRSNGKGG